MVVRYGSPKSQPTNSEPSCLSSSLPTMLCSPGSQHPRSSRNQPDTRFVMRGHLKYSASLANRLQHSGETRAHKAAQHLAAWKKRLQHSGEARASGIMAHDGSKRTPHTAANKPPGTPHRHIAHHGLPLHCVAWMLSTVWVSLAKHVTVSS